MGKMVDYYYEKERLKNLVDKILSTKYGWLPQKEHDDFYFDASIRNLAIRTAYYQNDEEKFQEHLSKFLQFANSREDFLLSSEFYIDICGLLLDADRIEESRLILDHMNNCTKDFPQAFLRFYVQRIVLCLKGLALLVYDLELL